MAGSRQQHLTSSFMRACLRCLPMVDTDVLLLLYVPAAVISVVPVLRFVMVYQVATTAALVHEESEGT